MAQVRSYIRAADYIRLVKKNNGDYKKVQAQLKRMGVKGTIDSKGHKDEWQ